MIYFVGLLDLLDLLEWNLFHIERILFCENALLLHGKIYFHWSSNIEVLRLRSDNFGLHNDTKQLSCWFTARSFRFCLFKNRDLKILNSWSSAFFELFSGEVYIFLKSYVLFKKFYCACLHVYRLFCRFSKIGKTCPNFGRKCPDSWVKFFIYSLILIFHEKKPDIFPVSFFFFVL